MKNGAAIHSIRVEQCLDNRIDLVFDCFINWVGGLPSLVDIAAEFDESDGHRFELLSFLLGTVVN